MKLIGIGKSFKLSKKILCILLSATLCLMLLPSALFKTPAVAGETLSENNVESSFGEFVYDSNSSSNNVVYDEKTLLEKTASIQETELSIVESATASAKASLIENKFSMIDQNFPEPEKDFSISPSAISSISSELPCLSASKLENTNNWEFVISDPISDITNGKININVEFSSYKANYLIAFENNYVPESETKLDFSYASATGTIKLNPSGKIDNNGHNLVLVSIDVVVKPMPSNEIKYGVSIKKDTKTNTSNLLSLAPVVNASTGNVFDSATIITNAVVEGSGESIITFKGGIDVDDYTYSVDTTGVSSYFDATPTFDSSSKKVSVSQFVKASQNDIKIILKALNKINGSVVATIDINIKKILPKTFDVDISSVINDLDMREWNDQKDVVTNEINNVVLGQTKDNNDVKLLVDSQQNPLNYYKVSWNDTNTTINKDKIKVAIEGVVTQDYAVNYTSDSVNIKAPESTSLTDDVLTVRDNGSEVSIEELPTHIFIDKSKLTICSKTGYSLANKSDNPQFVTYPFTPTIDGTTTDCSFNIFIKASDYSIQKTTQDIVCWSGNPYIKYTINNQEAEGQTVFGTILDKISNLVNFVFSKNEISVTFYYPGQLKSIIDKAKIRNGEEEIATPDDLSRDTDSDPNYIKLTKSFSVEDFIDYESNIKNWTITPTWSLFGGMEMFWLTHDVVREGNTQPTQIVAQAPAPYNVSYSWSTNKGDIESLQPNVHKVFDSDVTSVSVKVSVTMSDPNDAEHNASDLFKYTQSYMSETEIASIYSEKLNNKIDGYSVTYQGFTQDIANKNLWTADINVNLAYLGTERPEDNITLSINKIVDLLGRTALNGETTNKSFYFSIDNSRPELSIEYGGPDPVRANCYTSPRWADIKVIDLNFDGDLVSLLRNYCNEEWVNSTDSLTSDTSKWVSLPNYEHYIRVDFPNQGDYDLNIYGKDTSGNILTGIFVNNEGKYQSEKFTQDWTAPTLNVSWDNSNVVNGKYYNNGRNVTFTINERNFDSTFVKFNGSNPSWSSSGINIWTMSQSYSLEGDFSIILEGCDLALISFTTYSDEFTLDWTNPNIHISGVENRQAYGDTAQPNVSITDANMAAGTTCQVESLGITKGHPYSASPSQSRTQYTYSYANPEKEAENDGVYRINVNAVDMAGNTSTQSVVWSVNRFGSTYVIDAETETIIDGYVSDKTKKDVVVTEINPSGLQSSAIDMTKNSFTEKLKEGDDYTTESNGGGDSWFERTYKISKDRFKEDGKYTLNYYSTDQVGNLSENTMEKNANRTAAVNVQFMLDNTKPTCTFDNLAEPQYGETKHNASVKFEDNSKKFSEGKVIINGEEQYVNGDDLEKNTYKMSFDLQESNTPYNIEAVSIDKAGNTMEKAYKSVVVSSNPFVRWFYNTPLFVGTLIGVAVLAAVAIFLIYKKRHKNLDK